MQVAGIASGTKTPEMKSLRQNKPEENSLQKQIEAKQKELEQLSEDKEMDPKKKLEKKKEIEAEIADLNNQLQQKRAERLQGKDSEKTEPSRKRDGFSEESDRMNSLLSADRSVKEAAQLNGASDQLKGKARVLRTEAKLDAARGNSAEGKIAQASELEHRADRLKNESAKTLGSVQKAEKAEETEEAEKEEKTEKDGEDVRIGDVTYTSDGRLVEASEEKEPELDERA